jgi:Secretion system C-terminal sorting domain
MKKIFTLLTLVCLLYLHGSAQNCSGPFATGPAPFTEVCNPSGAAGPYIIVVQATSDSTLSIEGLWEVPTTLLNADVDCNTQTFTIPRQLITSTFEIEGVGTFSPPNINVQYNIYLDTTSTTPIDACSGIYTAALVGVHAPVKAVCALYPNPATAQTRIEIQGMLAGNTPWSYRVLDLQGRVVMHGDLDDQLTATIQVSALAQGVYRVIAQDGAGQRVSKALRVE